jgi:hypothetical protein
MPPILFAFFKLDFACCHAVSCCHRVIDHDTPDDGIDLSEWQRDATRYYQSQAFYLKRCYQFEQNVSPLSLHTPHHTMSLLILVPQLLNDPTQEDVWLAYAEFVHTHRDTILEDWPTVKKAGMSRF